MANTVNSTNIDDDCTICHGFHFVHPLVNENVDYSRIVPCKCVAIDYAKRRLEIMIRYCEFPPMAQGYTFENFNSYNDTLTRVKKLALELINAKELVWATFAGINDTGKTHLAVAICKEWVKQGVPAKYAFVPLLLDELREGFGSKGDGSYESRFKSFCTVPLLLLDDLGAENSTVWVQEKLETLIDYRYMNHLSLIVTTNLALGELSPRIRSRLMRHPNSKLIAFDVEEYTIVKREYKSGRTN
jgi:DNA replication protein DnaC